MEIKTFLSEPEEELHHPEHALQAWTNGFRMIEKQALLETERFSKHEENNHLLQGILEKKLINLNWSARAFYNAIEERYPSLSQDEGQLTTRKTLMKILQSAMNVVEIQRNKDKEQLKGSVRDNFYAL